VFVARKKRHAADKRNEFESQVCRVWLMIGVAAGAPRLFSFLCRSRADTEFNSISQTQRFYAPCQLPRQIKTHTHNLNNYSLSSWCLGATRLLHSAISQQWHSYTNILHLSRQTQIIEKSDWKLLTL
jgi:hypothetical protein